MQHIVERMLEGYEQGRIGRRELVSTLAAIAAGAVAAPAAESPFRGLELNHIALRVTDIGRSRDFYRKHLGLPVISESESSCFLGLGRHFLTFFKGERAGLDHYCIAIENYRADAVTEQLKQLGLNPRRTAERVYFPDPDGITVQFSSADHRP